jgi:hypothetical protein
MTRSYEGDWTSSKAIVIDGGEAVGIWRWNVANQLATSGLSKEWATIKDMRSNFGY